MLGWQTLFPSGHAVAGQQLRVLSPSLRKMAGSNPLLVPLLVPKQSLGLVNYPLSYTNCIAPVLAIQFLYTAPYHPFLGWPIRPHLPPYRLIGSQCALRKANSPEFAPYTQPGDSLRGDLRPSVSQKPLVSDLI